MIILCPSCQTSYNIELDRADSQGRKVKCAKCATVWQARPQKDDLTQSAEIDEFADALAQDDGPVSAAGQNSADSQLALQDDNDTVDDIEFGDIASTDNQDDMILEGFAAETPDTDAAPDLTLAVEADDDRSEGGEPDVANIASPAASAAETQVSPRRAGGVWRGLPKSVTYGVAAALVVMLFGGTVLARHLVVSVLPGTAPLYAAAGMPVNLRGLEFRNVTFENTFENGLPVLAIYGEVVNITGDEIAVPEIRYGLKDKMDNEIYAWTGQAQAELLKPAASAQFVTRLQSPPASGVAAHIRFSSRDTTSKSGAGRVGGAG